MLPYYELSLARSETHSVNETSQLLRRKRHLGDGCSCVCLATAFFVVVLLVLLRPRTEHKHAPPHTPHHPP